MREASVLDPVSFSDFLPLIFATILTGNSFTVVALEANNPSLLSNRRYMCRQTDGVSDGFNWGAPFPLKIKFEQFVSYLLLLMLVFCRLRSQLNSLQEASGGKRISVNDLVIKVSVKNGNFGSTKF